MCLYPREIKNKRYEPTKKNGGVVPKCKDKRTKTVPIPCGNCFECRNAKKREWQVRLGEEIKHDKRGKFVTFTFNNKALVKHEELVKDTIQGYERENAAVSIAVRRFLERWRKYTGKSVKHVLITELGHVNTERIHIHGFLWTNATNEFIAERWKNGNVQIGEKKYFLDEKGKITGKTNQDGDEYVNAKSVNYITKYISKIDKDHKYYKAKMYVSNGIGRDYINEVTKKLHRYRGVHGGDTIEGYRLADGRTMALPKYYKHKIWTDEQRERLWVNKLDEGKKYVDGQEIDITEHMEMYYVIRNQAREKNIKQGYGSNYKDHVIEYLEKMDRNRLRWCRKNGKHPRKRKDPVLELHNKRLEQGIIKDEQLVENTKNIQWDIMDKETKEFSDKIPTTYSKNWIHDKPKETKREKRNRELKEHLAKDTRTWEEIINS